MRVPYRPTLGQEEPVERTEALAGAVSPEASRGRPRTGHKNPKYPNTAAKLAKDCEPLLIHFAFPAEHWIHLRSTNAIESTFATVRLRTKKTTGAGSRAAGLAMTYKLLKAAKQRWRCGNAPHLVALVRAGVTFVDCVKLEPEDSRDVA